MLHDLNVFLELNHVAYVCMIFVDSEFHLRLHFLFLILLFAEKAPKEASARRFLRLRFRFDRFLCRQFLESIEHFAAVKALPLVRGPVTLLASLLQKRLKILILSSGRMLNHNGTLLEVFFHLHLDCVTINQDYVLAS